MGNQTSFLEKVMPTEADEMTTCALLRIKLIRDKDLRNKLGTCPVCNHNIKDRLMTLFDELLVALHDIYCWCGQHKCHEFETKQIKHLLDHNTYARFGDLIRFGGIVYKPEDDDGSRKGWFGINMKRARAFYAGEYDIPVQLELNQLTNEITVKKRVNVHEFPKLHELLTRQGLYDYEKEL